MKLRTKKCVGTTQGGVLECRGITIDHKTKGKLRLST